MNDLKFAAVQNGVILDTFDSREEAFQRVKDEIKRDWLSILTRKKLRKFLKKNGNNVSLHKYHVLQICKIEEVTE